MSVNDSNLFGYSGSPQVALRTLLLPNSWTFGARTDEDTSFGSHHHAFHVSDAEFDAIFGRIREAKLAYGSAPWRLDDGKLNDWNSGRGVYFRDTDGHVLELMTVAQ